jgi:hypothetical protein
VSLWTAKSLRNLAAGLRELGHRIGHNVVADLLRDLGYSLQANRKTRKGTNHPDRNAQFGYINRKVKQALAAREPAISVDTKKKELVGDFKNGGREYRPKGQARIAVFAFIEGFYNPRRRHSSLGYLSPVKFECQFTATAPQPGAHAHAVVRAPVKERPGSVVVSRAASATVVLDRRSTRQPRERAGRDEKRLATEPKDGFKKEDTMPATQIP